MNRVLDRIGQTGRALLFSILALFMAAGAAQAATTISTSISTGGTLGVTGLSSLGFATSTLFSAGAGYFGETSTSTFSVAGSLAIPSAATLTVSGASTLASTTATTFKVGQVGTQMSQIVTGYCVTDATSIAVAAATPGAPLGFGTSTQTFRVCTPAGSITLSGTSARVLVMATTTINSSISLVAASSTAAGLIEVVYVNTSTSTASAVVQSLNFWAFQ